MLRNCGNSWCKAEFEITKDDLDFYDRISPVFPSTALGAGNGKKEPIPPPTLCPDCRQQRRLSYRNERKFYRRKCDRTKKEIVSVYSPEKPCIVFDQTFWWSDGWDQLATARDVDLNQSFFGQILELGNKAPRPCILNMSSENALYTNHSAYNRNCYMCINTGYCEDCHYLTNFSVHSKDCIDCLAIQKCELCFWCIDSKQCNSSSFLHECINCSDCDFCYDCQGCNNCYGCWNLRHRQYSIFNEQHTKEQYEEKMRSLRPLTWIETQKCLSEFEDLVRARALHKCVVMENCEATTGDHLYNCKNVRKSYWTFDSEDCAYCYDCGSLKNSIDTLEPYQGELQYESHGCNLGYSLCACSKCYECKALSYCQYCWYCADCFGCFGIRNKRYCILNKQYTKGEYETLVPKIIKRMRADGEWGEFFPEKHSTFAYNETAAEQYFPLTKDEVLKRGWQWRDEKDEMPKVDRIIPAGQLPEKIDDVPDDILNWAVECEATKRPFRIIRQELDFYRKLRKPIPHFHPDERHRRRMALRNQRKLWNRQCGKCGKGIDSTYSPDRPEIVYCERCYLEAVY
jgi:hypothetical protein